jgi:hypothetical protein
MQQRYILGVVIQGFVFWVVCFHLGCCHLGCCHPGCCHLGCCHLGFRSLGCCHLKLSLKWQGPHFIYLVKTLFTRNYKGLNVITICIVPLMSYARLIKLCSKKNYTGGIKELKIRAKRQKINLQCLLWAAHGREFLAIWQQWLLCKKGGYWCDERDSPRIKGRTAKNMAVESWAVVHGREFSAVWQPWLLQQKIKERAWMGWVGFKKKRSELSSEFQRTSSDSTRHVHAFFCYPKRWGQLLNCSTQKTHTCGYRLLDNTLAK